MYVEASYKSGALSRAVTVRVILPFYDGWQDAAAPFPTLYFLPGYSADGEELVTLLPLRRLASEYGLALVIPDGENSFYTDHPERCALFSTFVGQELVETTRRLFPALSRQRADTFIGGISMGGYGALVNGLRWYDTFSRIAMLSPAADVLALTRQQPPPLPPQLLDAWFGSGEAYEASWTNPRRAIAQLEAQGRALPPMYMCCGEQDALVYDVCQDFARWMGGRDLEFHQGAGGHDLFYWDGMLDSCFRFLTKPL